MLKSSGLLLLNKRRGIAPVLPALSQSPIAAYGCFTLVPGYSGPLFELSNATSTPTTRDVYANPATGYPDTSGIAAWLNGSLSARVTKRYDQMVGGNHEEQTTDANRPVFSLTNAIGGVYSITFPGTRWLNIPAAVTGDSRSVTDVHAVAYTTSNAACLGFIGATYNTTGSLSTLLGDTYQNRFRLLTSSAFVSTSTRRGRSQPQVVITASGASSVVCYQEEVKTTLAANVAGTFAGGRTGEVNGASFSFNGEHYARIIYPHQVNDSEAAALQAFLNERIKAFNNYDTQLVWAGHSAVQGTGATLLNNEQRQIEPLLSRPISISNQGVFGQFASTIYANRASYAAQYRSGLALNICMGADPANDLNSVAAGSITGYGATVFNSSVLPFLQEMQSTGFIVPQPTCIALTWANNAAAREAERLAFNQLVRDNASTYGYPVVDYAARTELSSVTSTYYSGDNVHLNDAGYAVKAAVFAPVLNAIL